jgi:SPP1 gp7 family putative phage head morphogenesis protein
MTLNATNYSISKSLFEKIANAFKSAVKFIHRRGGYKAEYLKEEDVKPLIEHTYEAFSEAVDFGVKDNVIPEAMKMYLKNNTFVFSGFKTHQQLERVSRLLHDDDGHVKPFNRFLKDVKDIDKKYNRTYLQAEYNFAVASAQSAGQWHEFSEYADRYYLQYRTAKDERVREEHAILDGITLPMNDEFWNEFFPPNGWNCRCEAIQVSKKRYEPSNPSEALARGRAATYKPNADGINKAAIFRFNPGKEQRIFPKKHPYYKTKDAKVVTNIVRNSIRYSTKDKKKIARELYAKYENLRYKNSSFGERSATITQTSVLKTFSTPSVADVKLDILHHIEDYLVVKKLKTEEPTDDKDKARLFFVLDTTYKGNIKGFEKRPIQILFRENQNKTIDLYFIRILSDET